MTLYEVSPTKSVVSAKPLYAPLKTIQNLPDDHLTLAEAYRNFLKSNDGADANLKVPLIIRLLENPKSPVRLSGAVSLYHHDLIHCILGRGIAQSDEAFVIGMTMGSVKSLKKCEIMLYKFVSQYFFPGIYKFTEADIVFFDQGIELARSMPGIKPLNKFNPGDMMDKPLWLIRTELGIEAEKLVYTAFPQERAPLSTELVLLGLNFSQVTP